MRAERRPEIAARRFLEALSSIARCVTSQHLTTLTRSYAPNELALIRFADPPASLRSPRGGPRGLLLDVLHVFSIREAPEVLRSGPRWSVATRMYQYRLLDHAERELLVYHWQPGAEFRGPDEPHVHVSSTLNAQINALEIESIALGERHIATGFVSLAAVIRMTIEEFGVAPMRSDWREVLARTESMLGFEDTSGE